ncbi:MAG: class I SAM-dependent methyltransferase [Myxococcaceae bacterium]|nr:class I SAM-dependent methyltransferase [Myxococcaceae bacterium]MCI0671211.1 class I SAM-dependent methyltransferase [Myxococcaceae bacterium]
MHVHLHSRDKAFIPAAGVDWLLPLYDPCLRLLGIQRYRDRLIDAASIRPGHRVLDVGCGTGSLSVQVKQRHPGSDVIGIDPDPKALALARAKAARAGLPISFQEGFGEALPFADASFDRVVSSFVFHHLTRETKVATAREAARVLAPGGMLHVLDFGPQRGPFGRPLVHLFQRDERMADNIAGRIPELLAEAGLAESRALERMHSVVGGLTLWVASKPVA